MERDTMQDTIYKKMRCKTLYVKRDAMQDTSVWTDVWKRPRRERDGKRPIIIEWQLVDLPWDERHPMYIQTTIHIRMNKDVCGYTGTWKEIVYRSWSWMAICLSTVKWRKLHTKETCRRNGYMYVKRDVWGFPVVRSWIGARLFWW